MTMKILVTGGGGFVGRNLVKRLVADGHEVTITSTGAEPSNAASKVLYVSLEGIDWRFVSGQDVVFHQMANNDTRCFDRDEMWRANVYGPIKLFVTAAQGGCKKFIYASSTAVYGNAEAPYTEETPVSPLVPYAETKAKFDEFAMSFAQEYNVAVTGLRYCNVYGPGESHKGKRMSMVGQILRNLLAEEPPVLFRDGEQRRDWLYVMDAVEANVQAMNMSDLHKGAIYNIGSGRSWTFNDIVRIGNAVIKEKLRRTYDVPVSFVDCPFPETYQQHTECAIKKARQSLAFFPRYDLRSGIEEYVGTLINDAS